MCCMDDDDWTLDIMSSVPIMGGTEGIESMFGLDTNDDTGGESDNDNNE